MAEPIQLDTRGLRCPLPVLRLEVLLRRVPVGQQIHILADDPVAKLDIPHFAQEGGHLCTPLPPPSSSECAFAVTKMAPVSDSQAK